MLTTLRNFSFALLLCGVGAKALAGDLDLGAIVQPVPMDSKFAEPDYFIWCGAPARGADGRYRLYYSRWPVNKMNANHITMPKHFVADGKPWAGVIGEGFETSQPTLREIHMPPFQAAVKSARSGAIMLAYHASDCTAIEVDYVRIRRKKP